MPVKQNQPLLRLIWLDALRGIAATAVVLGHYFWSIIHFPGQTYFDPGNFGVAIFFLISGYIVPMSVKSNRDQLALRFAWSRAFRLLPLYWVSLLVGAVVYHSGLSQSLVNLTMLQRFVGVGDVIAVYWTLQVEVIFYTIIFVTLLAGVFNQRGVVASLGVSFALLAVLFGMARCYWNVKFPIAVPIGMAIMFVGNLKSLADTGAVSPKLFKSVSLCIAVCLVASFFFGYSRDWGYGDNPERFMVSYTAAVCAFFGVARFRWRTFTVAAGLGVISYPLYLFHLPVHDIADRILHGEHQVFANLASLVVVVVVAGVLHLAIEKPGVRLGRLLLQGTAGRHVEPVYAVAPTADAE